MVDVRYVVLAALMILLFVVGVVRPAWREPLFLVAAGTAVAYTLMFGTG